MQHTRDARSFLRDCWVCPLGTLAVQCRLCTDRWLGASWGVHRGERISNARIVAQDPGCCCEVGGRAVVSGVWRLLTVTQRRGMLRVEAPGVDFRY